MTRRTAPAGTALTVREAEVMDRIVLGLTDREISSLLFMSEHTVKSHLATIFTKLGAHNRTLAAVIYDRQTRGVQ